LHVIRIRHRIRDMGDTASGNGKRNRWTDDQVIRLTELWGTARDADVAKKIGKSIQSIRTKATELRLRDKKGRRAGCRPGKVTYPWRKEEDLVLVKNVGHLNIFELIDQLPGRNRLAIERRCYELGFSPTQGTYTRLQIERDTGYDWRQIQRARDNLGQTWKRYGLRKYMITFDQVNEIIAYLRDERRKWSLHYGLDQCVKCGVSGDDEKTRHSGDGLCKSCWDRRRHARTRVEKTLREGQMVTLTEDVWRLRIRVDVTVERRSTLSQVGDFAVR